MSSRSETWTVTAPAFRVPQPATPPGFTPAPHPRVATRRHAHTRAERTAERVAMVDRMKAAIGPAASIRFFTPPTV